MDKGDDLKVHELAGFFEPLLADLGQALDLIHEQLRAVARITSRSSDGDAHPTDTRSASHYVGLLGDAVQVTHILSLSELITG